MVAGRSPRIPSPSCPPACALLKRWLLLPLLSCLGALGACHPRPLPAAAPVVPYAGTWEYRYGDVPPRPRGPDFEPPPAGEPVPATDGESGWQPTAVLENPPGRNGARFLWMQTRLVGPPLPDPVLFLVDIDQTWDCSRCARAALPRRPACPAL